MADMSIRIKLDVEQAKVAVHAIENRIADLRVDIKSFEARGNSGENLELTYLGELYKEHNLLKEVYDKIMWQILSI